VAPREEENCSQENAREREGKSVATNAPKAKLERNIA
jgi:hypothetical protein